MAQTMICDLCERNPAQILVTIIATGDVQALDANCFADFALKYIKEVAPELLPAPAAKRTRKSQTKPATPVADDGKDDTSDAPAE